MTDETVPSPRRKGRELPRIEPRLISSPQLAAYFNRSTTWLYQHLAELHALGMPRKLQPFDRYDRLAVDAWLDRLGGLPSERAMLRPKEARLRPAPEGRTSKWRPAKATTQPPDADGWTL